MKYKIIRQDEDNIELEEIKEDWITQEIPAKRLEWGKSSDTEMTWEEAKKWCEKQGGRLPTIVELMEAYQGKVGGFVSTYYWSSSGLGATYAYTLYFTSGSVDYTSKSGSNYVRCVRGQ